MNSQISPAVLLLFLLILLSFVMLYNQVLMELTQAWSTNENYSHGFFIPFVTIYMVYSIRSEFNKQMIQPHNPGFLLIIAGLILLLLGKIGSELFVQRISIIVVLTGLLLFFGGTSFTRRLLIPLIYLIFMIPLPAIIWNKIAFPLQLFSSALTEKAIQSIGIAVFREGNILHLAETTLEVVAACSGLRSLMTMFALSSVIAWFSTCSVTCKWILFIAAAPIAVFINMTRLTATAIMASEYGADIAHGFLHDFSGFVTFALGFAMLLITNSALCRKENLNKTTDNKG